MIRKNMYELCNKSAALFNESSKRSEIRNNYFGAVVYGLVSFGFKTISEFQKKDLSKSIQKEEEIKFRELIQGVVDFFDDEIRDKKY